MTRCRQKEERRTFRGCQGVEAQAMVIEQLNWQSDRSYLLFNPGLSPAQARVFVSLYQDYHRADHIFIPSSGSSSRADESPKLVALSKQAFLSSAAAVNAHLQVSAKDSWALALPSFHVGGLAILARAHLSSSPVKHFEESWSASAFQAFIEQNKVSLSSLVPTQIFDLVAARLKAPSSLRALVVGGAALSEDLYFKARALGWPLLPSFGMTEACSQVATAELSSLLGGEFPQLKCLPHLEFKIGNSVTESGREYRGRGVLRLRGSSLLSGYAQMVRGVSHWINPLVNNWFQSQDLVQLSQPYLKPLGRQSDFVKINGEGVNLGELQESLAKVLRSAELHSQVCLLPLEDARSGSLLYLAVSDQVTREAAEDILQEYNEAVPALVKAKRWLRVPHIPRSDLGKLQLEKLKNMARDVQALS